VQTTPHLWHINIPNDIQYRSQYNTCYNADGSVIIQSHLCNVSANVYPNILVGGVDDFALNLLDHNVVVWVRSTSLTKYVMRSLPWSNIRAMSNRTNTPMGDLAASCFDSILYSSSYVSMMNWWNCFLPQRRVSTLPNAGLQMLVVRRVPCLCLSLVYKALESLYSIPCKLPTYLSSSSV